MDLISGRPFWPIKTGLPASYPPLDADVSCEIAIVGAGISGALVGYSLVEAGVDALVLDRRDVASGSTAASTSLVQYDVDVPLHRLIGMVGEKAAVRSYQLGVETVGKLEKIARTLKTPCGFAHRESLYLARAAGDLPALRREYEARRRFGLDVKYWNRSRIATASSLPHQGAILSRDAAQVDAYRLTHALLADACAQGLRIFDRTAVREYRPSARGIELRTARGPRVRARKVVFATGYEALVQLPGNPTVLHSTYAAVSEPLAGFAGWPAQRLLWEAARPYFYLRTTDDGRAIIGGADERFRDPRKRDVLLPAKARLLARKFREFFPKISFEEAYVWAGTFAETPDGLPYIGCHAAFPHAYFALGYGGNGITFSLIAAEIIRDLWLGRCNPDAQIFRFDR